MCGGKWVKGILRCFNFRVLVSGFYASKLILLNRVGCVSYFLFGRVKTWNLIEAMGVESANGSLYLSNDKIRHANKLFGSGIKI